MAYVKKGPFQNNVATPPLNAAFFDGIEAALAQNVYTAPPPSGGDDTSVLQPLWAAAQSTSGTLILQAGTYKANLATTTAYPQPRLIGQGRLLTILKGAVTTAPVVRFKGISGAISGGYLADLTLQNTAGVGLEIADACGVHWDRLRLAGTLTEGIRFHSESSGGYSEYNSGMADIEPEVVLPVRYMVTAGTGSNHGSGLTVGSVINQSSTSTSPIIQIDANAFPYSAPLSAAIFPRQTNGAIISNASGNTPASFFGHLDIEVQVPGPVTIASPGGARVYHLGTLGGLAASTLRMGQFYLADKIYYLQGTAYVQLRPYQRVTTLAPGSVGPLTDVTAQNGAAFLVNVNVSATNYYYTAQLMCWQSPTAPTGNVTTLASSLVTNGTAAGTPTFTWANYGLTITNANYSGAYTAVVGVTPLGGGNATDSLGQY